MTGATVTGRTYGKTRPRGFASWRPQAPARALVADVLAVLDADRAFLPLTARQVFYRLVGAHGYDKSEAFYERLLDVLNRGRRAGLVPWAAIRDDGAVELTAVVFDDPADFWSSVGGWARQYRRDRQDGQRDRLEVWCEAAGMAPQLQRVADPYGVPVFSSGGFDSVTVKRDAAARMVERMDATGAPTVVLHVGDYDPSGCAIVDSLADDVRAFCAGLGAPDACDVVRVAVTPDQVVRYRLPTQPPKAGARAGGAMRATVQAEALAPGDLAEEVEAAIVARVEPDARERALDREADERDTVLQVAYGLPGRRP